MSSKIAGKEKNAPNAVPPGKRAPQRVSSFGHAPTTASDVRHVPKPSKKVSTKLAVKKSNQISGSGIQTNNGKAEPSSKLDKIRKQEAIFDAMLAGNLDNLPPLPRSIVRIFLSSTFSDMKAERNCLARDVYPQLKAFCAELDLDFQVVDMRWGVREDSQNDHSVEKICLKEIENCQQVSLGPNFVCIIGDRYGFRGLPTEIGENEYDILSENIISKSSEIRDLLDTWYKKDSNAVPAEYVLQPIKSQFPFYDDQSPDSEKMRIRDREGWNNCYQRIQTVLREAAEIALKAGKISANQNLKYFMSVTECEISQGVLNAADPRFHVLCYRRVLSDLNVPQNHELIWKFTDIVKRDGEVKLCDASRSMLSAMTDKITNVVGKKGMKTYNVPWKGKDIDPVNVLEHGEYISTFCTSFIEDMKHLIQAAHTSRRERIRSQEYYSDYDEVLHHLLFCNKKVESFQGQVDILKQAKKYIMDEARKKPFIIYAQSGAGKTSVMAMIMKSLQKWLKSSVNVIRFLGTSPGTVNIYDVLFSVCGQLADEGEIIMEPMGYKNMKTLIDYLPRFLRRVASVIKKPIIVLLDSIDQLSGAHDAYLMKWLPTVLPANFHLILSMVPTEHGILENVQQILPDKSCYAKIPLLNENEGRAILESYLTLKNRTLTVDQLSTVLLTFLEEPSPLFLKLLADDALTWPSFASISELHLSTSVKHAITHLFECLEKKFGKQLIASSLGFITLGVNGISEVEMEDALSCDDAVLNEVYQFHNPPVEDTIRIPPVLWARIHHDIKEYLVERLSFGKVTLFWYHRQFIEAARARYAQGDKQVQIHRTLALIYNNENGIKKDIKLKQRNLTISGADRLVTHQPLTVNNKRKLECLAHHLCYVSKEELKQAKQDVFCNFRFLATKIMAFSVEHYSSDLNKLLLVNDDPEIRTLLMFLESCKTNLKSAAKIAFYLLAVISDNPETFCIHKLLCDAKRYLLSQDKSALIPTYHCLATRNDIDAVPVKDEDTKCPSLYDEATITSFDMIDGQHIVAATKSKLAMIWSLKSEELIKSYPITLVADQINVLDNSTFVAFNKENKTLKIIGLTTEKEFELDIPNEILAYAISFNKSKLFAVSYSDTCLSIHQVNINKRQVEKSFKVQKGLNFVNLEACLSKSKRYLVLKAGITKEDFKVVEASWKKIGGFLPQNHPYRFAAVDLLQTSGSLLHCYRQLTKIPTLGETMTPLSGNIIMMAVRRSIVYWDIPTGKCDQRMSKVARQGMIYRPDWLGQKECQGTSHCVVLSPCSEFVAVGSQDGYLMIYSSQTGLPVGLKASATKHPNEVSIVVISDNSEWVASACKNHVVKLWLSKTATEVVNISLDSFVHQMMFTADSKELVVLAGTNSTRVMVFKIHSGTTQQ